jgi:hypothetical protein
MDRQEGEMDGVRVKRLVLGQEKGCAKIQGGRKKHSSRSIKMTSKSCSTERKTKQGLWI